MTKLQSVAAVIWRETFQPDHPIEWQTVKLDSKLYKRVMAAARGAMAATIGQEDGTVWKPIPGFPRYEASSRGTIRRASLPDGTPIFHPLKPHQDRKTGHLKVSVYCDGKQSRRGVHQLVALAFHGEAPEGKPIVCHINGDAGDCRPENLRWGSQQDNIADMRRHLRERRSVEIPCRLTKVQVRPSL